MAPRNQTGNVIAFPAPAPTSETDQRARRVWQGIEADDPPAWIHEYANLLAMAEAMLASREKRFPAMVRAGKLAAGQAEAELATFQMIAADWRWLCTGAGQPASIGSLGRRRDALDASLCTIADIAREQGGFSPDLTAQADAVIAMRWHLEPGRQTHALAAVTHAIRADSGAKQEGTDAV